jgi:Tfp pilus assembly protein PilF
MCRIFLSKLVSLLQGQNASLLAIVPICILFSLRIVSRNDQWNSELKIYKSALAVCPLSVKALTNYASLVLSEGSRKAEESVFTAATSAALYGGQRGALINLGIGYDRNGQPLKSIRVFEQAIKVCRCSSLLTHC